MNFQRGLDLLRCHSLASAHAIDAGDFFRGRQVATGVDAHDRLLSLEQSHIPGHLGILLHLLLRVPEPLVDLVHFQIQLVRQVQNLLALGSLAVQILIHLPEGVFLALGFARAICASIDRSLSRLRRRTFCAFRLLTAHSALALEGCALTPSCLFLSFSIAFARCWKDWCCGAAIKGTSFVHGHGQLGRVLNIQCAGLFAQSLVRACGPLWRFRILRERLLLRERDLLGEGYFAHLLWRQLWWGCHRWILLGWHGNVNLKALPAGAFPGAQAVLLCYILRSLLGRDRLDLSARFSRSISLNDAALLFTQLALRPAQWRIWNR